ncbi:MAG TPA: alpha/beta hydrolase [Planctomycetota bacterium]|nr:alpha/beta hydrolase [Planctomycetota bacterium]
MRWKTSQFTVVFLSAFMCGALHAETLNAKGVKIHYIVEGKGEPVVLIHGFLSSALLNWQLPGVSGALSKDYKVILMDVRGHGASDKPVDDAAYGTEMVEDVVRILDELKISKAHIVGYSMGGMIAGKLMVLHPDRVKSVALCGMGWLQDGSLLQKFWEGVGKDGRRKEGEQKNESFAACARSFAKLANTEAEMKAVKVPFSVIVGEKDIVKLLYVLPLQAIRKDVPVTEIPEGDHFSTILKPEFKDAIKKWLDKQTEKK